MIRLFTIKVFNFSHIYFSIFHILPFNFEIELGKNSKFKIDKGVRAKKGFKVFVRDNASVSIGENTVFNYNAMLVSHMDIKIGSNCQIGPNLLIYDHDHDFTSLINLKNQVFNEAPVRIGDNCWVGANVTILKGSTIGDNCIIGAGSLIKGHIPSNSMVYNDYKLKIKELEW